MTEELKRKIRAAQDKLAGRQPTIEEHIAREKSEGLEQFKRYLASHLSLGTRFEISVQPYRYFWAEAGAGLPGSGPALSFEIEGRDFLLMQEGENCRLFVKQNHGSYQSLLMLEGGDERFEVLLLASLGDVLDDAVQRPSL